MRNVQSGCQNLLKIPQQAKLNRGSIHVKTGNQFKINSNPHLQIVF